MGVAINPQATLHVIPCQLTMLPIPVAARRADHSSRGILPTVAHRETLHKQVKINRSNRWATPEATIP